MNTIICPSCKKNANILPIYGDVSIKGKCIICLEENVSLKVLTCGHTQICNECIPKYINFCISMRLNDNRLVELIREAQNNLILHGPLTIQLETLVTALNTIINNANIENNILENNGFYTLLEIERHDRNMILLQQVHRQVNILYDAYNNLSYISEPIFNYLLEIEENLVSNNEENQETLRAQSDFFMEN